MEQALKSISTVITVLFALGVVGCALVIPLTAFQLFKVLFEPDTEEEVARSADRAAQQLHPEQ